MTTPAPVEDQARLLEDALVAVRQQTSLMRKCLETPGKLMDALKCWSVPFSSRGSLASTFRSGGLLTVKMQLDTRLRTEDKQPWS
jgi:hypothetical protein